jgi:hypothetical protein
MIELQVPVQIVLIITPPAAAAATVTPAMQEDSRRANSIFRTHEGECHTLVSAAGAAELDYVIGAPRGRGQVQVDGAHRMSRVFAAAGRTNAEPLLRRGISSGELGP